jgi:hypothetical protein
LVPLREWMKFAVAHLRNVESLWALSDALLFPCKHKLNIFFGRDWTLMHCSIEVFTRNSLMIPSGSPWHCEMVSSKFPGRNEIYSLKVSGEASWDEWIFIMNKKRSEITNLPLCLFQVNWTLPEQTFEQTLNAQATSMVAMPFFLQRNTL